MSSQTRGPFCRGEAAGACGGATGACASEGPLAPSMTPAPPSTARRSRLATPSSSTLLCGWAARSDLGIEGRDRLADLCGILGLAGAAVAASEHRADARKARHVLAE